MRLQAACSPEPAALALPPEPDPRPVRLAYLDGLRGLAALCVVCYHAIDTAGAPPWMAKLFAWARFGPLAVSVFIVLSGYCLMLPVVRAGGQLKGGARGFLARRARRILPTYYAALGLSLVVLAVLPLLRLDTDPWMKMAQPGAGSGALFSHLLLLHNLRPEWASRIDGPMWSLATEWQIYLLFPFVLLPLWNRAGALITFAAAFAAGLSPIWLSGAPLAAAHPWYLSLFVAGMCAAALNFSPSPRCRAALSRPGSRGAGALSVAFLGGAVIAHGGPWQKEVLVGLATACFLVAATSHLAARTLTRPALAVRLLTLRPVLALGAISYSLYLVHVPIAWMLTPIEQHFGLTGGERLIWRALFLVPALVAASGLFYLLFERRWAQPPAKPAAKSVPVVAQPESSAA